MEEVPARALMAAYRLPHDGTRACDAADLALTILGGGESSRLYNRLVRRDRTAVAAGFGLLRLAGAPSMGWLDVKTSGDVEVPVIEAAIDEELARFAAEGPTGRGDGAGPGPAGARVAGPARHGRRPRRRTVPVRRPLRRPAARPDRRQARPGGDPEEVQEVAKARLRPDNRAVLVYEPKSPEAAPDAEVPEDPEQEATVEAGRDETENEETAK